MSEGNRILPGYRCDCMRPDCNYCAPIFARTNVARIMKDNESSVDLMKSAEFTERIKQAIRKVNNISSLQLIEVSTMSELEELLPHLESNADAIVGALQELSAAINIIKN